ncbi:hypothetical protein ABN034_32570 [Actinopolymorpha sp. B11F2]|uniref:hypothetical protein n=1 Tax=Actinopolymorpha sp. B11F2 TaxID=3160862 RepID=UPI0032E4CBB4
MNGLRLSGLAGGLPEGVHRTATAPSPWILVAGRTLVEGWPPFTHCRTSTG